MLLHVKVVPCSRRFGIRKKGDVWEADLAEPPEKNRANAELVRQLEKITGRRVRILRGATGKKKVLEIEGNEQEIRRILSDAEKP
ncbi:MAG TPA: DUF167 domain-containing protein [Candidatus Bilamarchaeaceae archaeon]|nr:DUF167 domain-containing protein [Candidatus Bilamarchaeaceae archaeon]